MQGLPDLYVHDEIFEVNRALLLLNGEFDLYRLKGVFYYLLGAEYAVLYGLRVLTGSCVSIDDCTLQAFANPGPFVLAGRLTNVVLGTFSVYLTYRLAKRLFRSSRPVFPILVALGWATCWLAVWLAHWSFIETLVVVWGLLALLQILRVLDHGRRRNYVLAGALIGLTTATKTYGAMLLVPLIVAHLIRTPKTSAQLFSWSRSWFDLTIALGSMVMTVLVAEPSYANALLLTVTTESVANLAPATVALSTERVGTNFGFYADTVRWNLGNPMILFLMIGGIGAVLRKQANFIIILAFGTAFLLTLGLVPAGRLVYMRYTLVAIPPLFLLTVYGIEIVDSWLRRWIGPQRVASGVLLTICGGLLVWNGLGTTLESFSRFPKGAPVEREAREWIETNVPAGSKIVLMGDIVWPGHQTLPLIDLSENYETRFRELEAASTPEGKIAPLKLLARMEADSRYDLLLVNYSEEWKSLQQFLEDGAEFFVIEVDRFEDGEKGRDSNIVESRTRFYSALKDSARVRLSRTFSGATLQGGRKTVEIYETVQYLER